MPGILADASPEAIQESARATSVNPAPPLTRNGPSTVWTFPSTVPTTPSPPGIPPSAELPKCDTAPSTKQYNRDVHSNEYSAIVRVWKFL
jgi:hypothetical protein